MQVTNTYPQWYKNAEKFYGIAKTTAAGITSVVEKIGQNITSNTDIALSTASFLGMGYIIFAIPNLVRSITRAIASSGVVQRIKHAVRALISGGAITETVSYAVTGLKAIGVIAEASCSWAATLGQAVYPLQFLAFGVGVYNVKETAQLRSKMREKISVSKKLPLPERVRNLTSACSFVLGNTRLRKTLGISKSAGIDDKVGTILKKISDPAVTEKELLEGEKFVKQLKTRVSTKLAIEILSTVVKVASIIVTGLLLFTNPIAALFALSIAITAIGIAVLITEKVMINKDPNRQPNNVCYDKALHHVRTTLYDTGKRIRSCLKHLQVK